MAAARPQGTHHQGQGARRHRPRSCIAELADGPQRRAGTAGDGAGIEFTASGRRTSRLWVGEGLGKRFGAHVVVSPLDLLLTAGRRLGIIGRNGSGKTTLLRILVGEIEPDAGTIEQCGGAARRLLRSEPGEPRPEAHPGARPGAQRRPRRVSRGGRCTSSRGRGASCSAPSSSAPPWVGSRAARRPASSRPADAAPGRPAGARRAHQRPRHRHPRRPRGGPARVHRRARAGHPRSLPARRASPGMLALDGARRGRALRRRRQWLAARARHRCHGNGERRGGSAARAGATPSRGGGKRLSYREQREWDAMEEAMLAAEATAGEAEASLADPVMATDAAALEERLARSPRGAARSSGSMPDGWSSRPSAAETRRRGSEAPRRGLPPLGAGLGCGAGGARAVTVAGGQAPCRHPPTADPPPGWIAP